MDLVAPESGIGAGIELLEVEHGELYLSDGADGNNNQPAKSSWLRVDCAFAVCI